MESTRQAVSSLWGGWSVLNFVLQRSEPAGTSPSRGHTWTLVKWITLQLDTDTWEHKARVEKFLFKLSALWHPTDSHVFLMQFFTWETHLNNSLCCHYLACTISTAADSHSLSGWAKKKISAFVSELLFLYEVCSGCAPGLEWCISNEMSFETCWYLLPLRGIYNTNISVCLGQCRDRVLRSTQMHIRAAITLPHYLHQPHWAITNTVSPLARRQQTCSAWDWRRPAGRA